jgi:hypothetical protein
MTKPPAIPGQLRMDKVRVIKRSLLCYNVSWVSLLPLLGIIPALVTLILYRRLTNEVGEEWNPARKYALWGSVLAQLGLLLSLSFWALLFASVLKLLV